MGIISSTSPSSSPTSAGRSMLSIISAERTDGGLTVLVVLVDEPSSNSNGTSGEDMTLEAIVFGDSSVVAGDDTAVGGDAGAGGGLTGELVAGWITTFGGVGGGGWTTTVTAG